MRRRRRSILLTAGLGDEFSTIEDRDEVKDRGKRVGLGFRNLREYNLAFLEKQGWRLLTNEGLLVLKVCKARYFLKGNFLSAGLGPDPSFIWRSVLEAKNLIHAGVRRSICDSKSTSILEDPWLPGMDNKFVTTYHPLVGRSVDSLLQVGTRAWDVELMRDIFNQHDRDLILSIQLSVSIQLFQALLQAAMIQQDCSKIVYLDDLTV
ncbi:hypothetical protein F8388_014035 [Cannabis sativa]|uniref:Uncharacterized protein n=1 Tax=Cannabis sativa TaxID=3483 RepID=A0A7J6GKV2_CANSA|nr:hypothetical protein G4B88_028351 [Cannabis sativa]KAF4383535.1 hypothetical protein F8388_014035 [Cannabis sativa]